MNVCFALFYIPSTIVLTIKNCSFIDISADSSSASNVVYGSVFDIQGSISIEDCYFHSCLNTHQSGSGGAICLSSMSENQEFQLVGTYFENCSSSLGGAVYSNVNTGWTVNVENCIFVNNLVKDTDSGSGGGLYLNFLSNSFASLLIKNTFFNNQGTYDGVDIGVGGDYSLGSSNFENSYSSSSANEISFLSSNLGSYSPPTIDYTCTAISCSSSEQRVLKECFPLDCEDRIPAESDGSCLAVGETAGLCRSYNGKCYLAENCPLFTEARTSNDEEKLICSVVSCDERTPLSSNKSCIIDNKENLGSCRSYGEKCYLAENCPPFTEALSNADDLMLICSKISGNKFFIKENGQDTNTCNSYDEGCESLDHVISTYVKISGAVSIVYMDSGNFTIPIHSSPSYENISLTVSIYNSPSINLADFHTYPIIYPFSTDFSYLYIFSFSSNCSILFEYIFFFLDDFTESNLYLFYSFFFSFFFFYLLLADSNIANTSISLSYCSFFSNPIRSRFYYYVYINYGTVSIENCLNLLYLFIFFFLRFIFKSHYFTLNFLLLFYKFVL
jgi:hypothetical protein